MKTNWPSITALMPTFGRRILPAAVQSCRDMAMIYPGKLELRIVWHKEAMQQHGRKYVEPHYFGETMSAPTLGDLRNQMAAECRTDLVMHMDDDDWSCPVRATIQATQWMNLGGLIGETAMLFWDQDKRQAWRYEGSMLGASMLYSPELVKHYPFPSITNGEDTRWRERLPASIVAQLEPIDGLVIGRIHGQNTSGAYSKLASGEKTQCWQPLEKDLSFIVR